MSPSNCKIFFSSFVVFWSVWKWDFTFFYREFLGQAWMKADKAIRAPHITLMTKRFNEVSQLVVSEIIRRSNMQARVAAIEKWAAVADISRVLHNYNGVLQICAAFTNTSVYRLKKTWEKVSKTVSHNAKFIFSSDSSSFNSIYIVKFRSNICNKRNIWS